jgi:hypothetical protein
VSTYEWNAGQERRTAPRVDLLIHLKGNIIALDEAATVQQLSLRGMTVHTTVPLSSNGTHDFRLNLGDRTLDVRTRAVHSRMVIDRDEVSYISGLAFVDLTPAAAATLEALIKSLEADAAAAQPPQKAP